MYKQFLRIASIALGNVLYALVIALFLEPSKLMTGGTTGIALVVSYLFHIPVWIFVFIFNVAMLFVAWFALGKRFAFSTILSTFVFPLALGVFENVFADLRVSNDIMLNTVYTGIGIGMSLGIVIRVGASTGGMDIPPLVLHKYFKIPVSVSMNVFDVCILAFQAIIHPTSIVLYSILNVFIYTMVLEKILMIGQSKIEVKVISEKIEFIRKEILEEMDRGLTLLKAKGGFLLDEKEIIFTIIDQRQLSQLEKKIHAIDPQAFLIVGKVSEVKGRGFTIQKQYR